MMAIVGPANRAVAQNIGTSTKPKFDVPVADLAHAVFMSPGAIQAPYPGSLSPEPGKLLTAAGLNPRRDILRVGRGRPQFLSNTITLETKALASRTCVRPQDLPIIRKSSLI